MSRHHPYGGYDGARRGGGRGGGNVGGGTAPGDQGPGPNRDYPPPPPRGGAGSERGGRSGSGQHASPLLNLAGDLFGGRPPVQQQQQQQGPPQLASPGAYGAPPSATAYGAPASGASYGSAPPSGASTYGEYGMQPPQGYAAQQQQQRTSYPSQGAYGGVEHPTYSSHQARPPPLHQSPPPQHQGAYGAQSYGAPGADAWKAAPPGSYVPPPVATGAPPYAVGGAPPYASNYAPIESTPRGEERPQRILFVRNIDYNADRATLRQAFDDVGEVKKMHDAPKKRGMVFVTYYDLRTAEAAIAKLKGFLVNNRPIDVHYCLPRDSDTNRPCDRDKDQGTLVVAVRNAHFAPTEATIAAAFGEYGELQSVRPGSMPNEFIVQYWDSRAAEMAFDRLNKRPFQGGEFQLRFEWDQPRIPGEARMAQEMRKNAGFQQPSVRPGGASDAYGGYVRPPPGPSGGYDRPPPPQREGGVSMRAWGQATTGSSARPPSQPYGAGSPSHTASTPGGYTHGPPGSVQPYGGGAYNGTPAQPFSQPSAQQQQQGQDQAISPPVDHSRLDQAQKIQLLLASLKNGSAGTPPAGTGGASPAVQHNAAAPTPASASAAAVPAGLPANIAALLAQAQAQAPAPGAAAAQQGQGHPRNGGAPGATAAKPANDVSNLLALISKR